MSNAQRKIVLIGGILLAPLLFFHGAEYDSFLIALGGPLISIGLGVYFWVARTKEQPPGGG